MAALEALLGTWPKRRWEKDDGVEYKEETCSLKRVLGGKDDNTAKSAGKSTVLERIARTAKHVSRKRFKATHRRRRRPRVERDTQKSRLIIISWHITHIGIPWRARRRQGGPRTSLNSSVSTSNAMRPIPEPRRPRNALSARPSAHWNSYNFPKVGWSLTRNSNDV